MNVEEWNTQISNRNVALSPVNIILSTKQLILRGLLVLSVLFTIIHKCWTIHAVSEDKMISLQRRDLSGNVKVFNLIQTSDTIWTTTVIFNAFPSEMSKLFWYCNRYRKRSSSTSLFLQL